MNTLKTEKIYVNGIILTQDDERSQVSQMATHGKTILAVGDDLSQYTDDKTETIDLNGAVVVPGFIDAHVHFLWGGETLLSIPAHDAHSKSEFVDIVKKFAEGRPAGSWLKGGGWNEHHFSDGSYPHRSWLDEAAPGHPMILTRHDGHSGIASSALLDLAGINSETADPQGGLVDRDEQGEPTGILRESAIDLVLQHMPEETELELLKNLETSQNYLLERGVTSVGDMIYDMNHFRFLQDMARQGKLKVRVTAYTPILKWPEMKTLLQDGIYEDEYFQYKGLKGFSDGSLGSHTALMLDPYDDSPDSAGIYEVDWKDVNLIRTNISGADKMGYQSVIHAIGDRAVREVLDVFQEVIEENGPRDRRFRVEHAQHIHPQDQSRFAELDVIASVQPAHCVDDALYANKLLGERCDYAYPFQSLKQADAVLAFGSDWPVSPADPVATIHGAVHRAGWHTEQALGLDDSVEAHTRLAAYACFREHDLGILKAGHLADFVVLDPDFQHIDAVDEILEGLIQAVFMDGKKV
ncbi:MAG: amidohydrolase [FCB group bacterium]|nr:amidohydrolase [FCB group bacterium]MBL7028572.1 amidohydrolase [Candidatus Neomarinimicrobiota bacterium]MBL7120791.1 amidohydrolase [Candidatus Neomarinimicrobiota bacterium]